MHAKKGNEVSKTDCRQGKGKGKRQRRWNVKSGIAVLLSAMLVLQSVDSISVQAEEVTGQTGETAETPEGGGSNLPEDAAGGETAQTPEGGSSDVPETPEGGSSDVPESGNDDTPGAAEAPAESTGGSETAQAPTESAGGNGTSETQTETIGESNTAQAPTESAGDNGTAEMPTEGAGGSEAVETPTDGTGGETTENPTETAGNGETAAETVTEETTTEEAITEEESTKAAETLTESETPTETGTETETNAGGGLEFVKTPEGAVILSGFEPLTKKESRIILDEKEALEEVKLRMPASLKAYAYVHIVEAGGEETEEEKAPISGLVVTAGGDSVQKIVGRAGNSSTGKAAEEGTAAAGEMPASGTENPDGGTAGGDTQPAENGNPEGNVPAAEGEASDGNVPAAESNASDSEDASAAEGTTGEAAEGEASTGENPGETTAGTPEENADGITGLEVPVTWECVEDYEAEELEEYHFRPVWDSAAYFYEAEELPTILVRVGKEDSVYVSTEEELDEAFERGISLILLTEDISLTGTLRVPATADIILDGQGFSLRRGSVQAQKEAGVEAVDGNTDTDTDEKADVSTEKNTDASTDTVDTDAEGVTADTVFQEAMIYLGGEDYTGKERGTLTLVNICIDGQVDGNRTGASAIIDYGSLILEEEVVIKNNDNYGNDDRGTDEKPKMLVNDYGGGIQVYGELVVTKDASVTGNFANEFGGGVYLADGSVLYLYADMIKENSVPLVTGYGADLYAADGSTVYYDYSVDMGREGFYICPGAVLVCMQGLEVFPDNDNDVAAADGKREIYISVAKDSGYTEEQINELIQKLEAAGFTVLTNKRVDIDTTDLRDWYVYDHYDPGAWDVSGNGVAQTNWEEEYGANNPLRKYYPYSDTYGNFKDYTTKKPIYQGEPVYTIAEWLERQSDYTYQGTLILAKFKEHIYTRNQDGTPKMTFVGYGHPAYIDFTFYNPESDGEKVVDFDVDSSKVYTHTMTGNGFLVNTGIENGLLYGYLVYYTYPSVTLVGPPPTNVAIYRLNGINVDYFHNGRYDLQSSKAILGDALVSQNITAATWASEMSIQIRATPNKIEVRQQPKSETADIEQNSPILSLELKANDIGNTPTFSGFGPMVAYTSVGHSCYRASCFEYSNLRMYFTNPELEPGDMLNPLREADFTQDGTQKYFLNLFGSTETDYNTSPEFGQYQEYLEMMQQEGIALITDRNTPFDPYLGAGDSPNSNLHEMQQPLSIEDLANQIIDYLNGKTTTDIQEQVSEEGTGNEGEGFKKAHPKQPVGNIWLKSVPKAAQVRKLYEYDFFGGNNFDENGSHSIQIMDDISHYYGDLSNITVVYDILKPNSGGYVTLATVTSPSGGGTEAAALAEEGADGNTQLFTPPPFTVVKGEEWPKGSYTVRQRIYSGGKCSSVYGYAYFDLLYEEQDPVDPTPPAPPEPETPTETETPPPPTETETPPPPTETETETPPPTTETETETIPPAPPKPKPKPPAPSEPAHVDNTPQEQAVPVVAKIAPPPKAEPLPEPKTGDAALPAIPISLGACTVFMIKIRMWLYEFELGISEEKKNEILQALFSWARGTTKPRAYMAVGASAVVLTIYHLLKVLDEKRKRLVEKFGK